MTKEILIISALRALVNGQVKQGSAGYALEEDSAYEVSWKDVLKWLEQQPSECTEHPCLDKLCRYYKQPCSDCISREAVNALVDELARAISDERCCISRGRSTATIMRDILHLPSVTPSYNSIKTELDCISRQEVLDVLKDKWNMFSNANDAMQESIDTIKALPPVTPQQTRWIPCSERMPEDNIHVLCQFTLSGMGECYLAHGVFHVVGGLVMSCNEVIAWMPLPEPYKEESKIEQALACADQDTLMSAT